MLDLMRGNPKITIEEMAIEVGLTRDGVNYNIKKLKKEGSIRRVKGENGEYWDVLKKG